MGLGNKSTLNLRVAIVVLMALLFLSGYPVESKTVGGGGDFLHRFVGGDSTEVVEKRFLSLDENCWPPPMGEYEKKSKLCHECYNLFREPRIDVECRKNCFSNGVFQGCIEYMQSKV